MDELTKAIGSQADEDPLDTLLCPKCNALAADVDDRLAVCACGNCWCVDPSETYISVLLHAVASMRKVQSKLAQAIIAAGPGLRDWLNKHDNGTGPGPGPTAPPVVVLPPKATPLEYTGDDAPDGPADPDDPDAPRGYVDRIQPTMRRTVAWMQRMGFDTCDSGDGVLNVAAGMEDALDVPHVFAFVPASDSMQRMADLLAAHVRSAGLQDMPGVSVEGTYAPGASESTMQMVTLWGVTDAILPKCVDQ